jgi:hypothetical protein
VSVSRSCEGTFTLRAGSFDKEVLIDSLGEDVPKLRAHLQDSVLGSG